jgi:hypothetical protein
MIAQSQWRFRKMLFSSLLSSSFDLPQSAPSPRDELELRNNLVRGEGWGEEMDKSTLTQVRVTFIRNINIF